MLKGINQSVHLTLVLTHCGLMTLTFWSTLFQVMVCLVLGAKRLPQPMLTFWQLNFLTNFSEIWIKLQTHSLKKLIWKLRRQKCDHFVHVSRLKVQQIIGNIETLYKIQVRLSCVQFCWSLLNAENTFCVIDHKLRQVRKVSLIKWYLVIFGHRKAITVTS